MIATTARCLSFRRESVIIFSEIKNMKTTADIIRKLRAKAVFSQDELASGSIICQCCDMPLEDSTIRRKTDSSIANGAIPTSNSHMPRANS